MSDACAFCNLDNLRGAEFYFEDQYCVYASTRDQRDPPDVLPGSGILIPIAHRSSPFDLTPVEWASTGDLLVKAKAVWDEHLAPDGYFLCWTSWPGNEMSVPNMHAHLHVVPRFDDEPRATVGGRVGIKGSDNIRPDPRRPGSGRARLFGRGRV